MITTWRSALAAAVLTGLVLTKGMACSCVAPAPPCQAYGQSPMIFLGTVTESLANVNGRITRARMRIDEAFKGVPGKSLVLFDDGMCDGPTLQVGEQYLMYTRHNGSGDVPSRGCTRSRNVRYAAEDLHYLRGRGEALPQGSIFGRVLNRTHDYYGNDKPASGAVVELSGPRRDYTTTTDSEGKYMFGDLEPGKYAVTASQAGHRVLSFGNPSAYRSATVEARGCAVVDVFMRRKWKGAIEGRVIRADGSPAPAGIELVLSQVENRGGKERSNQLFSGGVSQNERGEYAFHEVAPGRYRIVMNLYRFPAAPAPFAPIYWPGAKTESGALTIEVQDSAVERRFDFRLPPEPRHGVVTGLVMNADGTPASGAFVVILTDLGGSHREDTDPAGHFSFDAFEGFEYQLSASSFVEGWRCSSEIRFSLAQRPPLLFLVLDRAGAFLVPTPSSSWPP